MSGRAISEVLEVVNTRVRGRDIPGPGNCTRESVFTKRAGSQDRKETSRPSQP